MAARKKIVDAAAPVKRRAVREEKAEESEFDEPPPSYFVAGSDRENLRFVSSGCAVKDEALGGGYVLGRMANIVGDKSTGKTLQAMEILANFFRDYEDGWGRYAEAEAAFDEPYAAALGIPTERIEFNKEGSLIDTVEALEADMVRCLDAYKGRPGVYIIDSLDSLSDDAEQKRDFDEGSTFGTQKAKQLGKLFRMHIERFAEQEVLLIIVSQLRDKIGVMFGDTKTRSGGRALDFYATHIEWLRELDKNKQIIDGVERIVGVNVESYIKKNKVGFPFRKAKYPILFGYGIDDLTANVEWLLEVKREEALKELDMSKGGYKVRIKSLRNKGGAEVQEIRAKLAAIVRREWARIETSFLPKSRKY